MIKVIAMDLDGTLTQHKTPMTPECRATLEALSKKYKLLMAGAGMCRRIFNHQYVPHHARGAEHLRGRTAEFEPCEARIFAGEKRG